MKSAGIARSNGLYRHIRTSKEIIRNLLNDFLKYFPKKKRLARAPRIELTSSSVEGWVIVLRQKSGTLCFSPSF